MQIRSLGREDPLEEGMATHSNILAWRIPADRRAWQTTVHKVANSQIRRMHTPTSSFNKHAISTPTTEATAPWGSGECCDSESPA